MPALGVVIALALTVVLIRECGLGSLGPRLRGDGLRVAAAVVLVLTGLPWLFAEAGFYADDVPGLGAIFLSSELAPPGATHAAVHLGDHHGTSGFLLALTALLLSRVPGRMRPGPLRAALAAYLSLMLAYGLGNIANDAWLEQVVKRGWTARHVPSVTEPALSTAWGGVVLGAAAVYLLLFRPRGPRPEGDPRAAPSRPGALPASDVADAGPARRA
jgi:hypothetical protein